MKEVMEKVLTGVKDVILLGLFGSLTIIVGKKIIDDDRD